MDNLYKYSDQVLALMHAGHLIIQSLDLKVHLVYFWDQIIHQA